MNRNSFKTFANLKKLKIVNNLTKMTIKRFYLKNIRKMKSNHGSKNMRVLQEFSTEDVGSLILFIMHLVIFTTIEIGKWLKLHKMRIRQLWLHITATF
jgi:hypothetical protein